MIKTRTFSGSFQQAGSSYAAAFCREIAGFYTQEFAGYTLPTGFAGSCQRAVKRYTPGMYGFLRGMAEQSLLPVSQHVALLLHEEELYHRKLMKKLPHCSAAAIAGGRRHGAVVGQNWDWSSAYFPWLTFNRFEIRRSPRVLSLSFPGLPVCAGANSAGLSLMWTGAGYYPPLKPVVGVPTYALTFELLLKRSVTEAVEWLAGVPNAGAFIFFLADKKGALAVVEGVPGHISVWTGDRAHRANVFELPEACRRGRQKLPAENKCNSRIRNRIFENRFPQLRSLAPVRSVKSILGVPGILVEKGGTHATLVQMVADCRAGEMQVRLWREARDKWTKMRV